jgi:hypothetical protein
LYDEGEFDFLRRYHAYFSISRATRAVEDGLDKALTWVKNNAVGLLTRNAGASVGGVFGATRRSRRCENTARRLGPAQRLKNPGEFDEVDPIPA